MANSAQELIVQALVKEYHALLDEAVILAIAGEYNVEDPAVLDQVRLVLTSLSENVPVEEASGFDPSGAAVNPDVSTGTGTATDTLNSKKPPFSNGTLPTSGSSSPAEDRSTTSPDPSYDSSTQDQTASSTLSILRGMFMDLKEYDIQHAVQKAQGNFDTALDDLLNIQYLEASGQRPKGVDGFFKEDGDTQRKGKKKRKNRGANQGVDRGQGSGDSAESFRQEDIDYLSERLDLPPVEVRAIYDQSKFSRAATALEILQRYSNLGIESKDEDGQILTRRLGLKYKNIPEKYITTIVQVCGLTVPSWPEEIAALLNTYLSKPLHQRLNITYTLSTPVDEELESSRTASVPSSPNYRNSPMNLQAAADLTASLRSSSQYSSSVAAQLRRQGGSSSPLYRQAAAVYSDRAREQAAMARQANSTAADLLVARHRTNDMIDLHGVTVDDGVRIARDQVRQWWEVLGEGGDNKAKRAREQGGFTVVTGLGRHSAGGVSRLRQGVAAALVRDGWKLRVETGKFTVVGRQ